MATTCTHASTIRTTVVATHVCEDCVATGRNDWLHLRLCTFCGHVGCCDQSPGRHATKHFLLSAHPIIRSIEPGEDWYWCYIDNVYLEVAVPTDQPR